VQNGVLHIDGVTQGKLLCVYNAHGHLLYQGVANKNQYKPSGKDIKHKNKMKKFLKIFLITTGVIIGVLAIAWGGMFLKLKSQMKEFAPMETGRVVDNIFVVKDDFANVFILQDGTRYVVIDCGNSPAKVADQMKELGISPNNVVAV
jgi:hypothetical protein